MLYDPAFEHVVGLEGALSMDPLDPGNWTSGEPNVGELRGTKYGISAAAYPHLDIPSLTLNEAKQIYMEDYWTPAGCLVLPPPLRFPVFDCAVNQGVRTAVKLLQKAARVVPDGVLGPKTLAASRGEDVLVRFLTKRAKRYIETRNFDRYGDGWLNRLFEITIVNKEM